MGELRLLQGGQEPRSLTETELANADLRLDFDVSTEAALLSSIMVDESIFDIVGPILRSELFYSEAHRCIYAACVSLREASKPIDNVTVMTQLRDTGQLSKVGSYLTTVLNSAPVLAASNAKTYASVVRDKWVRREATRASAEMHEKFRSTPKPIQALLDEVTQRMTDLTSELGCAEKDGLFKSVLRRTVTRMDAANAKGTSVRMPTGFDRLDRIVSGMQQTLMILAGRPGMGKTSLATRIGLNVAMTPGCGTYFASMETFDEEACTRMWCAEAGVSLVRARNSTLTPNDYRRLGEATSRINDMSFWIDDESSQSVVQVWSKCRRFNRQLQKRGRRLEVVIIDYLQLLKAPRPKMSREEAVSENCRALLAMASDMQCSVLALSQLNRQCEQRNDKRPMISDLRESGGIEEAARVVCFVYRDEYYNKNSNDRGVAEIIVGKQNNGPTGTVKVRFDAECTRFDNIADGDEFEGERPSGTRTKVAAPDPSTMSAMRQEGVELVCETLQAEGPTTFDVLRRRLGSADGPGMTRQDVEQALADAAKVGSVRVSGTGDARLIWRNPT